MAKLLSFVLGFVAGAAALWIWSRTPWRPEPAAPVVQSQPTPLATPALSPPLQMPTVLPVALPAPELPPLASPAMGPSPGSSEPPQLVTDVDRLRPRGLLPPIAGLNVRHVNDTFEEMRGGHRHEAIDILAARGTPVVAVDEGSVSKLFTSKQGGLTVYQFDPKGEYCYYYAHLDRYADGLREGAALKRGDTLGYVGTTGNAPPGAPHLHFTIFRLGPEKRWWEGVAVNPYPLWAPATP